MLYISRTQNYLSIQPPVHNSRKLTPLLLNHNWYPSYSTEEYYSVVMQHYYIMNCLDNLNYHANPGNMVYSRLAFSWGHYYNGLAALYEFLV